jgi:hypothetical protein
MKTLLSHTAAWRGVIAATLLLTSCSSGDSFGPRPPTDFDLVEGLWVTTVDGRFLELEMREDPSPDLVNPGNLDLTWTLDSTWTGMGKGTFWDTQQGGSGDWVEDLGLILQLDRENRPFMPDYCVEGRLVFLANPPPSFTNLLGQLYGTGLRLAGFPNDDPCGPEEPLLGPFEIGAKTITLVRISGP